MLRRTPSYAALFALLTCLGACKRVAPYTLEGHVRDAGGDGIPNVEITAGGTNTTTSTNLQGEFRIVLHHAPNIVVPKKLGWTFKDSVSGQAFARIQEPQGSPRVVDVAFTGTLAPRGTIAFVSDRTGESEIWVMNADGSNQRQLTTKGGTHPSLRPDAKMVVYDAGIGIHLSKVPVSGGPSQPFARDCKEAGSRSLRKTLLRSGGCTLLSPAYSPRGRRIAYWYDPTSPAVEVPGVPQLFVMDSDGTGKRLVLTDSRNSYGKAVKMPPTWSPDGDSLAFASWRRDPSNSDIVVTDLMGHVTSLFVGNSQERNPSWDPTGKTIFVDSNANGSYGIWKLGHSLRGPVIGTDSSADTDPSVSPDGGLVAFVSDRDGHRDIYISDRDGVGLRQLTKDGANDDSPDWR